MTRQPLGIRQLRIIDAMSRYGDGVYQAHWALSHTQKAILESLRRRGIVAVVADPSGIQVYRLKRDHDD